MMTKIKDFLMNHLAIWIWFGVTLLCALFMVFGTRASNGSITLDGNPAKIEEYTEKFIEESNEALYRLMEVDAPTDAETIKEFEDGVGLGSSVTLKQVIARRLPDGDNDNGKGWQCSKYTAYLATGRKEYSTAHPDYGPVNGKDIAGWLVKNFGWKYIEKPIEGAIGSGGFNTKYGHTAMYLYSTGTNTAMVNDANWKPLTVATHSINISGWVWVVPGDYQPDPEPTPEPTPIPDVYVYTVIRGDSLGEITRKLNWYDGPNLYGPHSYTDELARYNNIKNPNLIYPGQTILRYFY